MTLTPKTLEFTAEGGTLECVLDGNESDLKGLKITGVTSPFKAVLKGWTVIVTVDANDTQEARTGRVFLAFGHSTASIKVTQAAAAAI